MFTVVCYGAQISSFFVFHRDYASGFLPPRSSDSNPKFWIALLRSTFLCRGSPLQTEYLGSEHGMKHHARLNVLYNNK